MSIVLEVIQRKTLIQTNISKRRRGMEFITFFIKEIKILRYIHGTIIT